METVDKKALSERDICTKYIKPFDIVQNQTTTLTLDFDAGESMGNRSSQKLVDGVR